MSAEHEVTTAQNLLDANGIIVEPGYARSLIWRYNREQIKAGKLRIKEWDYYLVTAKDFAIAFTVSDLGFIALLSVSLLSFTEVWEHTKTLIKPLPLGKLNLPRTSVAGDICYKDKHLKLEYLNNQGQRRIICELDDLYAGKPFSCDIKLQETLRETICIATPWKENPTRFYYNQKINCMQTSGYAKFNGVTYEFDPQSDFGTLDWGRGVWTYDNIWYWATANAVVNGLPFGFNLGYGFSDRSSASENMLFYNGAASKLDEVNIEIPLDATGAMDYLQTWRFSSSNGRFEAELEPILDRQANLNFGLIASVQHQVFGRLNGSCQLDDGTVLQLQDVLCATEHIHNKY
jgi:hypothetical protein